ncbi:hypothetical protein B7494_g4326 [Chlorociboria aeruginascens]|nr:hypothetical protein B7494_g4326 [Chlorociboria aeruginascens]
MIPRSLSPRSISTELRLRQRFYHSYDHPPHPGPFTPTETAILSAAIPHIPSHGFTHTALALGAKDAGFIDASTNLFPSGAFSLVHYHLVAQRLALANHKHILHSAPDQKPLGIRTKTKLLLWERLMGNRKIIHRWQEPTNIPTSIAELTSLSDEIWFLAGDTDVDVNWYTKRTILSSIYGATELYMTTDKSPDYTDTKEFLDRRFRDFTVVGKLAESTFQWVGFTAHAGINVLRSKGIRI